MTERDEACERLLGSLEDVISILERGKEECAHNDWEIFPTEEIDDIIEQLRELAEGLNMDLGDMEDVDEDE